jgi:hypothetical protein
MAEQIVAAVGHRVAHIPTPLTFLLSSYLFPVFLLTFLQPSPAAAIDCKTSVTAVNSKLELALGQPTIWQTRGGEVRFTIAGLDPAKDNPSVVACLRWKLLPRTNQPAPRWTSLLVSRVGTTKDAMGLIFSVTIPDLDNPPVDVEATLFGAVPTADLRIVAAEGAGQPTPELDATRDIGVTSKSVAAVLAVLFAFVIGLVLYIFALLLGVPGRGVILRIISTASGWASLAQFQIILWTLVIGAGAVYVMTLTGQLIEITTGTLVLLGIAGGAAVGSQLNATQQAQRSTTANSPGQVTGLGAEAVDESSLTLSWQPPTGGSTADNYAVQYRPAPVGGAVPAAWRNATIGVVTPRFTIVGLDANTTYDVQVFALNPAGSSAPVTSQAVARTAAVPDVPAGAPATVTGLGHSADPTATTMPIRWDGQVGVTYTAQYRMHDSDHTWRTAASNLEQAQNVLRSLGADTAYDVRVRAHNNAGAPGPWSAVFRASTGTRVPCWTDIIRDTDRAAEIDVTRVQMLFFTVISAFFVALGIATTSTIPEIPGSYVALMGISNGVYLTAKFLR